MFFGDEIPLEDTLKTVERISAWPIEALNIALFGLVLFVVWRYLRLMRGDFQALRDDARAERKEYIESLKGIVAETNRIVERNNMIFERLDRYLEKMNQ